MQPEIQNRSVIDSYFGSRARPSARIFKESRREIQLPGLILDLFRNTPKKPCCRPSAPAAS